MNKQLATAFPLGVYTGNPNGSDPAAEASFEATYNTFSRLMGAQAQFTVAYVDQRQPISQWISNASWQAWSDALSSVTATTTPVIGLPMTSTAAGSPSADQTYKNFASGLYDPMLRGVVKVWADNGFKTQYWRPGWEMNLSSMPSYAGDDGTTRADWVAAFQHISTVLHAAGASYGVNVQVVWNPGTSNYSGVGTATQTVYPGNQYVDVIGADVYADLYPYGETKAIYDWDKSGQVYNSAKPVFDTNLRQWASDPINLLHYWTDPAATQWSADGSAGHSLSLQDILDFAGAQGKPVAIAETGAGNTTDGAGVSDDPAFVQWLSSTLAKSTVPISFVNVWDSNGGGNYEFSKTSDNKPREAAAWARYFGRVQPQPIAITSTTTSVAVTDLAQVRVFSDVVVADANPGQTDTAIVTLDTNVNGTLSDPNAAVDGSKIANGVWTASGSATAVATALDGLVFTPTAHQVGAGEVVTTTLTATVTDTAGQTASATSKVTATASVVAPAAVDTLDFHVSEDAWQGDARYYVSIDGATIGGVRTSTGSHAAGASQDVSIVGGWGGGPHTIGMTFINDAYGGSAATDRNLYVDQMAYDGRPVQGAPAVLFSNGLHTFAAQGGCPMTLHLAEDAWKGDARYAVSIDGGAVGEAGAVTASNTLGDSQSVYLNALLTPGLHDVAISFLNDAYGGTQSTDRNLYIKGIDVNGTTLRHASAALMSAGTDHFQFSVSSS